MTQQVLLRRADGRFLGQTKSWVRLVSQAARITAWQAALVAASSGVEEPELLDPESLEQVETQHEWLALAEEAVSIEAAQSLLRHKKQLLASRS